MFARYDPRFEYFVRKKMMHLQLWHPLIWVSVLTPSKLTLGRFEIFPIEGWKCNSPCLDFVNKTLREKLGAPIIDRSMLRIFQRHLIHEESIRILQQGSGTELPKFLKLQG